MRPLVRIAWRDIRRSPGRSLLITAMVGLPVAAVTTLLGMGAAARLDIGKDDVTDPATAAVLALVIAAIVLEVVLLAGAAFAVGMRRQRRALGLVAAVGGHPGQLRGTVLAGGLLLGALGAASGVLLGALTGWLVVQHWRQHFAGPYGLPPGAVLATAAMAALSGLLAAAGPAARAARLPVVAALAGREGQVAVRTGMPLLGAALTAGGVLVSVVGVRAHEFGVATGAVLTTVGLILATPAIVALAGRLGARLPVPARFAVRDAARHRARTAPAVAAIIAAVSGFTALAIGGNSDNAQSRQDYVPALPLGTATAQVFAGPDGRLPDSGGLGPAIAAAAPGTHPLRFGALAEEQARIPTPDCECTFNYFLGFGLLVGEADLVPRLTGRPADPAWARALAGGGVVVLDGRLVKDGRLSLGIRGRTVRLPAVVATQSYPLTSIPAPALLSPATATRLGLTGASSGWLLDARNLDGATEQRLRAELQRRYPDSVAIYIERGYQTDFGPVLLGLAGVALVLVLGGALIATGLAAADARPDLATMAAVGAGPRVRRLISMSQAGVVALLGTVIGTLAGLVPGIAITWPLTANGNGYNNLAGVPPHGAVIDVPWLTIAGIGLGVPVLTMLVVGACTRARLPLTRRLAL